MLIVKASGCVPTPGADEWISPTREESIDATDQTHRRYQPSARGTAEQRPAPGVGGMRNGRARVWRPALHSVGAPKPRLFPHHDLHLADYAGRRFRLARSRPDWKRRHVRDTARARR